MRIRKRIYLDHAATTPLDPRVLKEMQPYFSDVFGNPGSLHAEGVAAKNAVFKARQEVAGLLGATSSEVIFTSGGTEGNNLAILGVFRAREKQGVSPKDMHFVTTTIEHSSVRDVYAELESRGAHVTHIGVDADGIVSAVELKKSLRPETVLVSVMYANNEIGVIEPIADIAKVIRHFKKTKGALLDGLPLFHTDASQAPLYLDVRAEKLGVDFMVLDGQKIYGPKGVGVLYKKKNVSLEPVLRGGGQEFGLRPGTENVPAVVGVAAALRIAEAERERESRRLSALRDVFIRKVLNAIPCAELNGHPTLRLPNNANISFPGRDGEWLAIQIDARGIAVGTKSACLSEKSESSYVIRALGKSEEYAAGSLRFTSGRWTTRRDMERARGQLLDILDKLY